MDPLTHGLASYAVKRGFFPRLPRVATGLILLAGTFADLDWLSYNSGPPAFLRWHRTYLYSVVATAIVSLLLGALAFLLARKRTTAGILPFLAAPLFAGLLHPALDICQAEGVMLLWPFRSTRFALDWLPNFDPWILAILLLAILAPELFRLVSREIGAKTRVPHGRNGALAGLAVLLMYAGVREAAHANAAAILRAATYAGETPKRVAAFPDSASLFTWHGVVETPSALHTLDVSLLPGAFFNPDSALAMHKPENSPLLEAAQNTAAAQQFLAIARFPKATVEGESNGYSMEIRDLRYAALRQTTGAMEVNVNLDRAGKVTFAGLDWEKTRTR